MNEYRVGQLVNVTTSTAFQSNAGTAFDPEVVTFTVTDPAATSTDYVYGTDAEVTKNATGDYTLTIPVDAAGFWHYAIVGEQNDGSNRGSAFGRFLVRSLGV